MPGIQTLAAALVAGTLAVPASAQPRGVDGAPPPATVRLVSAETALRPGDTGYLGLLFEIQDGWHIYWDGINESGFAPTVEWDAPSGVTVHPILWHAPHRYVGPGNLLDHVYEGQTLLLVPVEIPADAPPGSLLTFRARVDWLVCKEACLPGDADLRLTIPVASDASPGEPTEFAQAFEASRERVPQPWVAGESSVRVDVRPDAVEILAPGARTVSYYPQSEAARATDLLRRGQSTQGRLRLELRPKDRGALSRDPVVRFVIEADYGAGEPPVLILVEKPLSDLGG